MGYIAKGTITLDTVNDAYTVSLTKSSCVIHADFDGSNPQLDDAWTQITVCRGDKRMAFDCTKIEETNRPEVKITTDNRTSYIVRLTSVPSNSLEGSVGLHIHTDDGWNTDIRLAYTIVRESTMLDWIKDWEGGKTKIGGTYIMTPKLFIGKKENFANYAEGGSSPQSDIMAVPGLTGVYIGPDASSTGLYGYSNSKEIFRLNDKGGMIGGWTITEIGLTSRNGLLQILGDGAIKASNDKGDTMWEINQDGAASFAKGNVNFYANGNADFKGKITSTEGSIGGWSITQNQIWKGNLGLDCRENAIGVAKANIVLNAITNEPCLLSSVKNAGGVAIFYGSETNWGLIGYKPSSLGRPTCVFELGAANSIAGWSFDQSALWSGIKNDTVGAYTTDGITLGANGIRGKKWYIDTNGNVSFMGGLISFSADNNSGEIVGWKLNAKRLSNPNVAIVSDTANAGIFMSVADGTDFNNFASSSLTDYIDAHGGIYMKTKTDGVSFAAYDQNGYKIFKLRSNGVSSIANWNIEKDALFVGSKKVDAGSFTDAVGSMTFSGTGIRGNKWRLEADGSGSLAGDMISWNAAGEVDFKAKVSADNITAGTISACTIQSSTDNPTWKLNPDGSGYLANRNISWKTDGSLTMSGEITASSGKIGDFSINSDGLYYGNISKWTSTEKTNMSQIGPNFVRMEQQVGYFSAGDIAYQKIGLGAGSDPTQNYESDKYCGSALYIYRKMNSISDMYFPAAQIISDNVANRNIGLRVVGGLQVYGGIIESGYVMEYTKSGDATVLDVSFGTTFLLFNRASESHDFFFPKLSQIREQLGISDKTKSFCVPVRVICGSGSSDCCISAASAASNSPGREEGGSIVDNNGNWDYKNNKHYGANRMALGAGDSWSFALIYTPSTGYYIQILNTQN